jgi:hypothetical protein
MTVYNWFWGEFAPSPNYSEQIERFMGTTKARIDNAHIRLARRRTPNGGAVLCDPAEGGFPIRDLQIPGEEAEEMIRRARRQED